MCASLMVTERINDVGHTGLNDAKAIRVYNIPSQTLVSMLSA